MAMLFSDGSDVSCNAYTNPANEPDKITRYRINDKKQYGKSFKIYERQDVNDRRFIR